MIDIEDFPEYCVTEAGEIYSKRRGIVLKGGLDKDGYRLVTLSINDRRRTAKVHREVCKAYHDNPNNFPCVNHIDGVKTNNHPSNLEWCTVSHNTKHAYKLGALNQKGANNNACKYSDDVVMEVLNMHGSGIPVRDISLRLNIPKCVVYSYVKGLRRRPESSTTIPSGSTLEAIAGGSGEQPKG